MMMNRRPRMIDGKKEREHTFCLGLSSTYLVGGVEQWVN